MTKYFCDYCSQSFRGEPPIVLSGVAGRAGLSLPGKFQERCFCSEACFWPWKGENTPAPPEPQPDEIEFEP